MNSVLITEPNVSMTIPSNAIGEFIGMRDMTGKMFDLGNNSRMLKKTIGAIHYPESGILSNPNWLDSDPNVIRKGSLWVVEKAWHDFELLDQGFGYTYTSKVGGIASKTKVELLEINDIPIDQLSLNLTPTINGRVILFRNIQNDLDFEIKVRTLGVDIFKIFKSDNASRKFTWLITEGNTTHLKIKKATKGYDNVNNITRVGEQTNRALEILITIDDLGSGIFRVIEEWTGRTLKITNKQTRQKTAVNERIYPCELDQDVSESISDNQDDGVEYPGNGGTWYYNFNNLAWTSVDRAAFRFQTVNVNQGQQLTLADLTVFIMTINTSPFNVDLVGEDVDDAAQITDTHGPSDFTNTDASGNSGDITANDTDAVIDMTTVCQEIFDRDNWSANNALTVASEVTPVGSLDSFALYNHATNPDARLDLTFAAAAADIGYLAAHNRTVRNTLLRM